MSFSSGLAGGCCSAAAGQPDAGEANVMSSLVSFGSFLQGGGAAEGQPEADQPDNVFVSHAITIDQWEGGGVASGGQPGAHEARGVPGLLHLIALSHGWGYRGGPARSMRCQRSAWFVSIQDIDAWLGMPQGASQW